MCRHVHKKFPDWISRGLIRSTQVTVIMHFVFEIWRNTRMSIHLERLVCRSLAKLVAMSAFFGVFACTTQAQSEPPLKWEFFGGYSIFYPGADVHGQLPGALFPLSSSLEINPRGAGASVTYNFNHWFGWTLDSSIDWGSGELTVAKRIDDTAFSNFSTGPKITFRTNHFSLFAELLGGDHRLSPDAFHDVDKFGFMAGGGLDLNLNKNFALRVFRADFVFSDYRFGPAATTGATDIKGVRLQAGINIMFGGGGAKAVSPSATCSVQPTEVFEGEPVIATVTGYNFNPKHSLIYHWSGSGVKVAGTNATAQIDTTDMRAQSYGVTANLSDGSKNGFASCSTKFTIKEPHPPAISCPANPAAVQAGGVSTISSNAGSPDGRRLTYNYSASAGDISGSGSSATLNTRDAQPGQITVTCTASDDRNPPLTASATTMVNVVAPPAPAPIPTPAPQASQLEARLALHSIYFQTARPTTPNPQGGLLESQEEILRTLSEDYVSYLKLMPDAHLILGGHADPRGSVEYNKGLTQRRVDRTKSYLVAHGVPEDHIETRSFGKEDELSADQIKQQIVDNPDLSADDRQKLLNNLAVMVLANNRRVDVSLSTTGQQSTRRYPFNAKDFLALISTKGGEPSPPAKPAPKKIAGQK
jgi:outer membrane protein OmpA-like peptidoglycan-associated protein